MHEPIFITGCARSGTSLVARCVKASGAAGGTLILGDSNNPHGFFENAAIREKLIKPALIANGCDPLGQDPLPDPEDPITTIPDLRKKVQSILQAEGVDLAKPWFYKCAKIHLMWRAWHGEFPDAKYIIVRRSEAMIVDSCLRTGFMQRHLNATGWFGWVRYQLARFAEMRDSGLNVKEVWSDKLIAGDYSELKDALEWAGLTFDPEIIKSCIDPAIWTRGIK